LSAQTAGLPLYLFLGGALRPLVTDVTLGIDTPERTAEKAVKAIEMGFRHLKVKLGLDTERDVQAVREVRRAVGPDVRLRLDANQAWGRQQAVETLRRMEPEVIEFCEQPIPKDDVKGLRFLADRVAVPIMADEAVFTARDVLRVSDLESVPYINLKVAKTGGIRELIQADAVATTAGLTSMLGCMMESRLGLTASAHAALACGSVRFLDLDTHFELAEDPVIGGIRYERDEIQLPESPGLGASMDAQEMANGRALQIEA
jgi:L-alanine-DL-glutamate epimerase-like enolase superfamily enzyme